MKPDQTRGQTLGKQGTRLIKPGSSESEEPGVELTERPRPAPDSGGAILGGASRQLRQGFELLVGGEVSGPSTPFLPNVPLSRPASEPRPPPSGRRT